MSSGSFSKEAAACDSRCIGCEYAAVDRLPVLLQRLLKGAMDAIGYDGDKLNVVLMQLVKLVKDGELVKMKMCIRDSVSSLKSSS